MKEYVVLKIENNVLIFNFRTITKEEKSFLNNDSFKESSLYYGLKKYKKNINKVVELLKDKGINTLIINRLITFKNVIELVNSLNIENIDFNFLSTIDSNDYELFLTCKSIKNIECYFMSSDYLNKFKEKNIVVKTRTEKTISNKFMECQNTTDVSSFYYRKVINIKEEYSELIDDLREFLKINYKLKGINIYVYSKELISAIVGLVKSDESRNVVVFLHQEFDKGNFIVNNIKWLRELSEKCRDEYTCEFRIIYSNRFLSGNLFRQLTFNNLKLISILFIYVCIVSLLIIKSYDYIEKMSINELNNQIVNADDDSENDIEIVDNIIELGDDDQTPQENITKEEVKSKYSFEKSFKKLKKINKETVGYLVVNNTEISYPVVQHSDNNYYLKRDFYKNKNSMGWIYLDYRNKINDLNDNSIIYGHSMLNGTMFGTLKKVLDSSWRKEEENMIISLDTEKNSYKFKIFSAYKVDYTTDYLVNNFETLKDKEKFIKLIKGRSSFKSSVKISSSDKILTLSTCTGSSNKRLVVHAVLLKEEK